MQRAKTIKKNRSTALHRDPIPAALCLPRIRHVNVTREPLESVCFPARDGRVTPVQTLYPTLFFLFFPSTLSSLHYEDGCCTSGTMTLSSCFCVPGWREPLSLTFFSFLGGGGYAFSATSCHSFEAWYAT